MRSQLFTASGLVVDESRDRRQMPVGSGESADCEASFWGVNAKLLGEQPEKAHVVISVNSGGLGLVDLGEASLPENATETVQVQPVKLANELQVVSASICRTEPDGDGDCWVQIRALVQNLTDKAILEAKVTGRLLDKVGGEISDVEVYEEIRPGAVAMLQGSSYVKEKQLKSAKVKLSMQAFRSVAAGLSQKQGMAIIATERDSGHESLDEPDFSSSQSVTVTGAMALADNVIVDFKKEPRNKVFVNFSTLLASAIEEIGREITGEDLSTAIDDYQLGDLDDESEAIYDGAVAICGYIARSCFGGDPDDDIDYDIQWIQEDNGEFTAEVRPG